MAFCPANCAAKASPRSPLSPPVGGASTTDADGMLQASEIAQLKLNADLVVLSACNTAEGGDELGGSALQGLSDSFFAAGARAVVASHWEVPTGATETLMTALFDPTNRSRGLAQGLRRSQLALIAQPATSHPFYWAAFTIIGDEGAGHSAEGARYTSAGQP